MEMTLRWYGHDFDTVTLKQIRQIPGVTGVITTLYDTAPGEVWQPARIRALKEEVEAAGLRIAGIRPDGSTVLAYNQAAVDAIDPEDMFSLISKDSNGSVLPGWEPARMAKIKELFAMYREIDDEALFENLRYFLERIMPVCGRYDINMAIHPDDPAWSVFGRIHFAHVRNLKFNTPADFEETAHLSSDGSFDMYAIMKALYEIGFTGPIRPDHGRMIWDETAMPGYGLYDRALGAAYLNGLWEAIEKGDDK